MGHDEGMPTPSGDPVRHLWLLRHGKAASDAPWGGSDRERPLTARGRRHASALGARLAGEPPVLGLEGIPPPEVVICSAAVRTRQTAALVVQEMGDRVPLDAYRSLYGADADLVLQVVRQIDEGVTGALVVGHNPAMAELAWELVAGEDGDGDDGAALEAHGFPTCALAVVALGVAAWEDAVPGCGRLAGLFKPPY
jgi:phosphohistidine phosphatase